MSIRTTTLALATAALLAAGCTQGQNDAPAPAPAPQSAQRESAIVTTATVEKVDQQTREVTLRGADGEVVTVVAGPEVRNLPQLRVGDRLTATFSRRIAILVRDPGAAQPAAYTATAAQTGPAESFSSLKDDVIGTTAPRTKLGAVMVTVDRMLVPNSSDAVVTNTAQ